MIKFTPCLFVFILLSCGAISEDDARTKLNNAVQTQIPITCDCIRKVTAEGDEWIEQLSACKGDGQSAIFDVAREDKIDDAYPELYDEMIDDFYSEVENCP